MTVDVDGSGKATPVRVFVSYARLDRPRVQLLVAALEDESAPPPA